jgi:stage II sporulation protein D
VITRRSFVAFSLAAAACGRARAQSQFDPATSAPLQALRVLLGPGEATALAGGGFTYQGRSYRGTFTRTHDGQIVNTVGLEEYLYSVVPREMPPSWPAAALAAQAICARTYVLARSNPRRTYDLVPSQVDQVYGGIAGESPAARAAVDATTGSVLRYGDGFALIVYSSCCGGHTESSHDAWGGTPIPYLNGVACATCTDSPHYRWTRELDPAAIERAYGAELAPVGPLQSVRPGPPDSSGRIAQFDLQGQRGYVDVKGTTFRLRVGARALPSLLIFSMRAASAGNTDAPIGVQGGGLGHGVGLCQWGARGLALRGSTYADILRFYFPGTEIDHD